MSVSIKRAFNKTTFTEVEKTKDGGRGMIQIVKMRIRLLVDMLDETDIVFLSRVLVSLEDYVKEKKLKQ